MKDVLMQREPLVPSYMTEPSEIPCDPSFPLESASAGKVRRSATLLGLAISLGALGMVFPQHRAAATSSPILRTTLNHLPPSTDPVTIATSPDSLTRFSAAHLNRPQLIPGARPIALVPESQAPAEFPRSLAIASTTSLDLEASKEHLREARKRLQEGLSELNANANSPTAESRDRQIQTEDVSRPLVTAGVTSLPPSERDFPLVKREIPSPNLPESQPTPIAASTLESFDTDNNNFVRPIPIPVPTPESALPKAIAPRPGAKTDGSDPLPSPEPIAQPPAESLTLSAFNQPIPISVPTPVSPEAVRDSQPPSLPVLDRETARDSLPEGAISYQVRHGDTLNDIARRYGISVTELARTNHIGNPNRIEVSQSLVIPFPSSRVQSVPPRPQSTESLPLPRLIEEKADGRISPVAMNPLAENRPVSPAVDAAPTEKLKAEIDNLEATYGQPLVGDPSSVGGPSPDLQEPAQTPDGASLKSEPAVNPEWQSDRPGLASENSPTQEVAFKPREEQIVGAAPSDAQNYNDSLRLPVGYEVSPELPPLSSPENYLPDTPVKFTGYIWPAKGVLTSGYGRRWGRMHRGIDIAAPIGTPIVAAAPGEVIFAGWNAGGYGNLVKVRHDDGSVTFYAHNSRIFVRLGQKVNQGEPISAMGSTGYSTGPHLHFEIRPNGKSAANPIAYLPSSRN